LKTLSLPERKLQLIVLSSLLVLLVSGCFSITQSVINPVKIEPLAEGVVREKVFLPVEEDVTIEGWLFWKNAPHTLLVFHGYAGNLYTYINCINPLLAELEVNLLMIDYRGYGRSTGKPSEKGIYRDALAAYEYLTIQRKVPPESLVLFGFSLGGGPAFFLANQKPVGGLIVEGTFTAMADAARALAGRIGASVDIKIESKFDNLSQAIKYPGRLLVMHAKADQIVPWEQGKKLFDVSRSEHKQMVTLKGEHCRAWKDDKDAWLAAFSGFLGEMK